MHKKRQILEKELLIEIQKDLAIELASHHEMSKQGRTRKKYVTIVFLNWTFLISLNFTDLFKVKCKRI